MVAEYWNWVYERQKKSYCGRRVYWLMLPHKQLLDTMVYMNSLYFALRSGIKHRHFRSSPCQIAVRERPYLYYMEDISKITQWGCMDEKKQAEGGHSSYKSRPSRALLYEFVQTLLCLNANKSPSRCFFPLAFTPSNINMLAPLNHWKTIR